MSKLDRIFVPELFYQRFIADIDPSTSTLVQKLAVAEPTKRGRGMSRVLENLTEAEWEELYEHAAYGRTFQQGTKDRKVTLRAAICAKALAERMEGLGVANPIEYTPKRRRVTAVEETEELPVTPPTVAVNEEEPETEEEEFGLDLNLGQG